MLRQRRRGGKDDYYIRRFRLGSVAGWAVAMLVFVDSLCGNVGVKGGSFAHAGTPERWARRGAGGGAGSGWLLSTV